MTRLLARLASSAVTLVVISVATFAVTNILPGDVATMVLGARSNPEALAALRESLGLNEPLVMQYLRWAGGMLTGDWGQSLMFRESIFGLVAPKLLSSALLVCLSMALALGMAVPLGVWAARRRGRATDSALSVGAMLGVSLPDFFWGVLAILVFARWLGWFPSSGSVPVHENLAQALRHAALPAMTLAFGLMALLMRMTRAAMISALDQEYIRVARAKGLPERRVIWVYALGNSLGAVITVAALQTGYLFGSLIVIESLFNYTGMGWLTYQALLNRDLPLIQTCVVLIAVVVMLANLLADLLNARIDPRLR